ncbi:MAG: hypothetical protein EHM58_01345 [Ignavibacteriae bacterium]|nr:MAG: hypothetical protein EHM58_01345 [Ignavibacteriota bacterium]
MNYQIFLNALATSIGYSVFSLALYGQFTYLRMISISLVTSVIAGAYGCNYAYLMTNNPTISILCGVICGIILGFCGAFLHIKIGREKEVMGLLGSFGYFVIIQGLITIITGGGIEAFKFIPPVSSNMLCSFTYPEWLLFGLIISVLLNVLYIIFQKFFSLSTKAIATGDNYELSKLLNLNPRKIEINIQLLCGGIAGISGIIIAFDKGLHPDLGYDIILKAFAILIVTGLNIYLLFFWSFFLALIESIATYLFDGQIGQAVGLSIVVLIVLITILNKNIQISRMKVKLKEQVLSV